MYLWVARVCGGILYSCLIEKSVYSQFDPPNLDQPLVAPLGDEVPVVVKSMGFGARPTCVSDPGSATAECTWLWARA